LEIVDLAMGQIPRSTERISSFVLRPFSSSEPAVFAMHLCCPFHCRCKTRRKIQCTLGNLIFVYA